MNAESFKPLLERDKLFLEELYSLQSVASQRQKLSFAADQKLNTLIKLLYFISNGDIKLKKEHFQEIPKRIINLLHKHFEKKNSLKRILNSERESKVKLLFKVSPAFKFLLYPLFNRRR